jgi:hypothetical protein
VPCRLLASDAACSHPPTSPPTSASDISKTL